MNRFTLHLFSESLLSAGILIIAKIIGVISGLWITQASYTFSTNSLFGISITTLTLTDISKIHTVTSYSNAIFAAIMILFCVVIISRVLVTRLLTYNSRLVAKVIYANLIDWMENGQTIYPRMFAWLIFIWMTALLVLRDSLIGISLYSIPTVTITFAIICTILVFLDIERHLHIISFNRHLNAKKTLHSSN